MALLLISTEAGIAIMAAAFVLLLLMGRKLGGGSASLQAGGYPSSFPEQLSAPVVPEIDPEPQPPFPVKTPHYQLQALAFKNTDYRVGPPDPTVFFDEVTFSGTRLDSGNTFTLTAVVATPRGLEKYLRDKQYRYLWTSDLLVIERFDMEIIREMVLDYAQEMVEVPREAHIMPPDPPLIA
jgi:hypothetical protein